MTIPDIPEKRLRLFFDTAWERHRIFCLKKMGIPKPWTQNPIFQSYRFCNVFRRIDKTTDWLVANVIEPYQDNPLLWKTIMLYRYISRVETYRWLMGHEFDYRWIYEWMRGAQANKHPVFTSAFILNTKGVGGTWLDRVSYIFTLLKYIERRHTGPMFHEILRANDSIEQVYTILLFLSGVGPFMAYQYCMDFAYVPNYLLHARDEHVWTQLGLGAVRGMNRLITGSASRHRILFSLNIASYLYSRWLDEIFKNLDKEIDKTYGTFDCKVTYRKVEKLYQPFREIKLCDVEHWMCEFDKYCRGGSKKRKYQGT